MSREERQLWITSKNLQILWFCLLVGNTDIIGNFNEWKKFRVTFVLESLRDTYAFKNLDFEKSYLVFLQKWGFLFKIPRWKERDKKACEKINHPVEVPGQAGIYLIFRGLIFKHNAEIGQKDHLWMYTN